MVAGMVSRPNRRNASRRCIPESKWNHSPCLDTVMGCRRPIPSMDSARSLTAPSSVPLNRVETLIRLSGTSTTVSGATSSDVATTVKTPLLVRFYPRTHQGATIAEGCLQLSYHGTPDPRRWCRKGRRVVT